MQDRTINSALLNLRTRLIREDGPGLKHVEALLKLRGVPLPRVSTTVRYQRLQLRRLILEALRDGPLDVWAISAYVAPRGPLRGVEAAYRNVTPALTRMKKAGLLERESGRWRGLWQKVLT